MSLSPTQLNILNTLYPDNTLRSEMHTGDISILEIKGLLSVVDQSLVLTERGKALVETINAIRESYTNRDKLDIRIKEG